MHRAAPLSVSQDRDDLGCLCATACHKLACEAPVGCTKVSGASLEASFLVLGFLTREHCTILSVNIDSLFP